MFVSDAPFPADATRASLTADPGAWSFERTARVEESLSIPAGTTGKYVRIVKSTPYLGLAEVQVFGTPADTDLGVNVAPDGVASQSSTA